MKLYFLRHAHAENVNGMSDHDRRLTDKGRRAAHNMAKLLVALELQPDRIFSSPRIRALQTAEIVAGALKCEVESREEVNFGFGLSAVQMLTAHLPDDSEVLFVGHEPTFSHTIREITGGAIRMKKAGLARVDMLSRAPLNGELVWLLPPKVAAAIEG
jgi:phosphohistidine phosphatase